MFQKAVVGFEFSRGILFQRNSFFLIFSIHTVTYNLFSIVCMLYFNLTISLKK